MADKPNTAEPGKPRRRWFQFKLRTLLVAVLVLCIGLWLVIHVKITLRDDQWHSEQVDSHFPALLQDQSGNTALVYEPANSIIVMTQPRLTIESYPVRSDEHGRPTVAWRLPSSLVDLPFIENDLLILLPDGKEGRFRLAAGSPMKLCKSYNGPEAGAQNSMLQKAIDVIDDPTERTKAERFLGTFRGRAVEQSR